MSYRQGKSLDLLVETNLWRAKENSLTNCRNHSGLSLSLFLLNELLVPCVFSDALYVCLAGSRIVHPLVQMHSESSPADTLVSGQIYSRPPSQNLVSTPIQALYSTFP